MKQLNDSNAQTARSKNKTRSYRTPRSKKSEHGQGISDLTMFIALSLTSRLLNPIVMLFAFKERRSAASWESKQLSQ